MASLHLFWMVLNVGLTIALLTVFYTKFRYFSERYGAVPSGLLFILILATCQSSGKRQGELKQYQTWVSAPPELDLLDISTIQLIDTPTITLDQSVYIDRRNHSDSTHIQSFVVLYGFPAGLRWSLLYTDLGIGSDYHLRYSTVGILEWSLIGIPLYSQLEEFNGSVPLRHATQNLKPTAHTPASGPCPERNGLLGS